MNMVFYAIYDNSLAVCLVDQVANNTKYPGSPVFFDDRVSVFYCKHSLEIDLGVCVRHDALCFCMDRACGLSVYSFWSLYNGLKPVVVRWIDATHLPAKKIYAHPFWGCWLWLNFTTQASQGRAVGSVHFQRRNLFRCKQLRHKSVVDLPADRKARSIWLSG